MNEVLHPQHWAKAIGYSNGIATRPGEIIFLAGQIGWDAAQRFHTDDLAAQFEQALRNMLEVLTLRGGRPEHICRITAFCTNKAEYLAARKRIGFAWRQLMGAHYPAMTMVFVSALLDEGAKIELEATAVISK
jgi:enamine deaminase RidA (YjgF/YER057c/UK114 family)